MVIAIIGESCTGKSTISDELARRVHAKVFMGKDYLKLAKSEPEARKMFIELLSVNASTGETIIFVITETEHLSFLPPKALRVLVTAELETIKARFAKRMNGVLPPRVEAMLEEKHGMFDETECDFHIENTDVGISDICDKIMAVYSES